MLVGIEPQYRTGGEMTLSRKAEPTEIDRVRLEQFISESDRDCRDTILGCEYPGYPFDQIGTNLHPYGMSGRVAMIAASVGAPKHQVMKPVLRLMELIDSLYPPDDGTCWRAASINTEPDDHGFDGWQVRTGPDASDFELRRGVELAIAQIASTEKFVRAAQVELAKRCADRHQARRQMRSSVAR